MWCAFLVVFVGFQFLLPTASVTAGIHTYLYRNTYIINLPLVEKHLCCCTPVHKTFYVFWFSSLDSVQKLSIFQNALITSFWSHWPKGYVSNFKLQPGFWPLIQNFYWTSINDETVVLNDALELFGWEFQTVFQSCYWYVESRVSELLNDKFRPYWF